MSADDMCLYIICIYICTHVYTRMDAHICTRTSCVWVMVDLPTYLCVCVVCLLVCLFVYLVSLSIYLSIYLPIYISISLYRRLIECPRTALLKATGCWRPLKGPAALNSALYMKVSRQSCLINPKLDLNP